MNILIFNWRDTKHPLAGGAEISLFQHAKYWAKKRARVTWFAASFKNAKSREVIDDIEIIRKGSHFSVHILAFFEYLKGRFGKPDIIVDCFHFLPFYTPLYFKKKKIVALINEVAGKLWFSNLPFPLAAIGYIAEPFFFRFYKNKPFITASNSTKNDLIKMGIAERNIELIPHGAVVQKIDKATKKEKVPTVLFLGALTKDKGIEDTIAAFDIIYRKDRNFQFWIAGKEEREGALEVLLKKYSNIPIRYFGFVSENEKFKLYQKAWLLVHPSQKEGWGLTVIEAASFGTPTVGYNVEGLRDSIKNGESGILTDPNYKSLADAVCTLIANKTMYNILSHGARDWAKNFTWNKSAEHSWNFLKKILDSRRD